MKILEYLFVYGTLKRGCEANVVLKELGAVFVDVAVTKDRHSLYDIEANDERYPALLLGGGESKVLGEVYLISNEALNKLDTFEAVEEGEYIRDKINVILGNGKVIEAYVYAINPEELERLIAEGRAKLITGDVVSWQC